MDLQSGWFSLIKDREALIEVFERSPRRGSSKLETGNITLIKTEIFSAPSR
jgi:hypothetical protein